MDDVQARRLMTARRSLARRNAAVSGSEGVRARVRQKQSAAQRQARRSLLAQRSTVPTRRGCMIFGHARTSASTHVFSVRVANDVRPVAWHGRCGRQHPSFGAWIGVRCTSLVGPCARLGNGLVAPVPLECLRRCLGRGSVGGHRLAERTLASTECVCIGGAAAFPVDARTPRRVARAPSRNSIRATARRRALLLPRASERIGRRRSRARPTG
jgi:hypothetical protein